MPFLVRRSLRLDDGAGEAPGARAGFLHGALEIDPGLDAQAVEEFGVLVERVAGEVEADGAVLALQALGR